MEHGSEVQMRTSLLERAPSAQANTAAGLIGQSPNGGNPSIGTAVAEMQRRNSRLVGVEKEFTAMVSAFGGSWPSQDKVQGGGEVSAGNVVSIVCSEVGRAHVALSSIESAMQQLRHYIG